MHIPDGYLSPATCAALYAGAAPFWYVALRRVRRAIHTRLVPVLSLLAAFSFVVMMFNIPLPGGTTGHAVGVGVATVVLGPAASMLAVSIALVIQAFFFGDGGITAIGANCFNMAIVGSLAAHLVYRAVSGRASLASRVRWVAAGLAGYVAVNAAALAAAIEFGLQPVFYRDAAGAPLYAPYPLGIAIPAMMIGHLTIAGLAEAVVSAGVVAFVQRTDASLLALNPAHAAALPSASPGRGARGLRPLWLGLGLLMLLTPLGILAGGTAWGEWAASDFASPAGRQEIAAASLHQAPPAAVPPGLARWSAMWTAPWADYAPAFVREPAVGYLLSAMFGVGLVVLLSLGAGRLASARRRPGRASGEGPS
jgi:cobalt/nickel transport system permease protein